MRYIRKLAIYFSQFGLLEAIQLILNDSFGKILDPGSATTYSQTGEDCLIRHFIGIEPVGFYVDVGCNHPKKYSNTFALYKAGWKGLAIDANSELIRDFSRLRPRDQVVCAVVSRGEGEIVFTEFKDPLLSSVDSGHVELWSGERGREIKSQKLMQSLPLNEILEQNSAPKRFALLTIDVEGHDCEVLSSLNLNLYRPKLIVIEMHEFDLVNPESNEVYRYLKGQNYSLAAFAANNGYFCDEAPYNP